MTLASKIAAGVCADGTTELILEASPHGIFCADVDGRVLAANRIFAAIFGFEPERIVGVPVESLSQAWRRLFAEAMTYDEAISHPLEDREAEYLRDVEVVAPVHRFVEVSSAPMRRNGAYAGRLWIMRDVTHEREITDLKIQYAGLRNADEITSKFLTVASHQLRTPMNAIRWNLDLLLSGDAGALAPASMEVVREAYASVATSISIVDDMLLAVDIEQRTLHLEKTAVDLGEIVGKAVREHARSAALRSQTLTLVDPPHLPPLFLDAAKMEKVFNRLIDNAIRYTPNGGTITVDIRLEKNAVTVAVRDNGIGVPKNERVRLFERFYRSKKAIDLNPNATGLGLYIASYIVDAHDGRISYETQEGKGSTFYVSLPRRSAT